MLYDLASGPPEPGSLLESVFLLISLRRREAELSQTEALVATILGTQLGKFEPIEAALQAYKNAMFPFLQAEKTKKEDLAKRVLQQWTSQKAYRVAPLWTINDGQKRQKIQSRLKKIADTTIKLEESRRTKRHTKL